MCNNCVKCTLPIGMENAGKEIGGRMQNNGKEIGGGIENAGKEIGGGIHNAGKEIGGELVSLSNVCNCVHIII